MNQLLTLSGTQQGRLIAQGEICSVELVQAHLDQIDEVNPQLNAAIDVLRESALAAARASHAQPDRGPFHGVPFSVKDSIEVKGTVCSAGTLGRRNAPASAEDAVLVARLRESGAIPLARTNLPDLLFSFESDNLIYGRTNNPYDLERTCGGSSGGEAALIAACGSPFGLGSDAAGSVRVPAHYCGIAALKPTSGRLLRRGHIPPASGWLEMLWQIGPMARRVEDLQTLMPILLGGESFQSEPVDLEGLRAAYFTTGADAETAAAIRLAARSLPGYVEENCPPAIADSYRLEMKMIGPDGGDGLRAYLKEIGSSRTHPLLNGWLEKLEPYRTDLAGFAGYWAELDQFRASMNRFLEGYSVILSPVSSQPAVRHGETIQDDIFQGFGHTMTHNLTGWPAGVVRVGTSRSGLPIGIQVAAAPRREDIVLAVLSALEKPEWALPLL